MPLTVGQRLKRHREQAGLSMRLMALELKVAESTLCRWEAEEREPKGEYLRLVERALEDRSE